MLLTLIGNWSTEGLKLVTNLPEAQLMWSANQATQFGISCAYPFCKNICHELQKRAELAYWQLAMKTTILLHAPEVSIIILTYNSQRWLKPCLESIVRQTALERVQIIVADNGSADTEYLKEVSTYLARRDESRHLVVKNGGNLGYCAGNNEATKCATGRFLFFLNPDTWLEPKCVERLLSAVNDSNVAAAQPLVLEYDGDDIVAAGRAGIDLTGLSIPKRKDTQRPCPIFVVVGCCFFIRRDVFDELGGFDSKHFMYVEEDDLSWRLWLSGHSAVLVPNAVCHHRGCNVQNPTGGARLVEFRTSPFVRYQNNRNSLLMVAKNGQHIMLLMLLTQLLMLSVEGLMTLALFRRWSYVRKAYIECIVDAWHLRHHVMMMRRKIRSLRKRSDWWILRHFLRPFYFNRFEVIEWIRQRGLPKMS